MPLSSHSDSRRFFMRVLPKLLPLFVLGFLAVLVPRARAQFQSGCCLGVRAQWHPCTSGNCNKGFTQISCPQYAGPGQDGIEVVAGGDVCCNTIYPQLFGDGSCTGSTYAPEQPRKLVYVRTCSHTYALVFLPVPTASPAKPAPPRRVSHETAASR